MGAASSRPRVILLEDDASLRRFVQLALEELDIDLVECARVAEALQALQTAPAQLLLTDLMLAGESALSLLERLASDASLRGDARIVVLSAGLTPDTERRLQSLGVWRTLAKPVALRTLERCVEEALQGNATAPDPHTAALSPADEAQAIARHFDGDAELYREFRDACFVQFKLDAAEGEAACAVGDIPALRRVAHNLKTVLRSLGYAALGDRAAQVEDLAARGAASAASPAWRHLHAQLTQLTTRPRG